MHKLAVALDFFYSTCARIGRADFQRAVAKLLGQPLADDMVSLSGLTLCCNLLPGIAAFLFQLAKYRLGFVSGTGRSIAPHKDNC